MRVKITKTVMMACWVIHCFGLLDPLNSFMIVYGHKDLDIVRITWAVIYAITAISMGIYVGRGMYLNQRWAITASVVSATLAVLMIHPLYVLFCPLVYLSPYTRQFDGPYGMFTMMSYGMIVAIYALPYLVIRGITLSDGERKRLSAIMPMNQRHHRD